MPKPGSHKVLIFLLLMFCTQYMSPYAVWGVNHASFLPIGPSLLLVSLAITLFWLIKSGKITNGQVFRSGLVLPALFVFLVVAVSLGFPLATDAYGDSYSILKNYEGYFAQQRGVAHPLIALIDFDIFSLHNGERFTFNSLYLLMQITGLSLATAFRLYGAMWALASALAFVSILHKLHIKGKFVPYLLFLSMNGMMLFAGHAEVYAPGFCLLLLFGNSLCAHFQRNSIWTLFWLALSCFFALKTHFVHVILVFPLMVGAVLFFFPSTIRFYTFRNAVVCFLSGLLGFALAYFFLFQAHTGNYAYRGNDLLYNVFLPIYTNHGMLHYGLLHPYHILDWLVLLVSWSPIAWSLLAHRRVYQPGIGAWLPVESVLALVLMTYGSISFVVNPLLSAPRDWDFLSVGAPILLLLATVLYTKIPKDMHVNTLQLVWIGFALFALPRYLVEHHGQWSGRRLLVLGSWVHQSYHAGSSVLFSKGVKKLGKEDVEFIDRVSERSEAHSNQYPDMELAHAFTQTGIWLHEGLGATNEALEYLSKAITANGDYVPALKGAAIILQERGDFSGSFSLVEHLQELAPDVKEHHQLLINYYHGMGMKKALQEACNNHLKRFPDDEKIINDILENL